MEVNKRTILKVLKKRKEKKRKNGSKGKKMIKTFSKVARAVQVQSHILLRLC